MLAMVMIINLNLKDCIESYHYIEWHDYEVDLMIAIMIMRLTDESGFDKIL